LFGNTPENLRKCPEVGSCDFQLKKNRYRIEPSSRRKGKNLSEVCFVFFPEQNYRYQPCCKTNVREKPRHHPNLDALKILNPYFSRKIANIAASKIS
jgi:hypothetical protein